MDKWKFTEFELVGFWTLQFWCEFMVLIIFQKHPPLSRSIGLLFNIGSLVFYLQCRRRFWFLILSRICQGIGSGIVLQGIPITKEPFTKIAYSCGIIFGPIITTFFFAMWKEGDQFFGFSIIFMVVLICQLLLGPRLLHSNDSTTRTTESFNDDDGQHSYYHTSHNSSFSNCDCIINFCPFRIKEPKFTLLQQQQQPQENLQKNSCCCCNSYQPFLHLSTSLLFGSIIYKIPFVIKNLTKGSMTEITYYSCPLGFGLIFGLLFHQIFLWHYNHHSRHIPRIILLFMSLSILGIFFSNNIIYFSIFQFIFGLTIGFLNMNINNTMTCLGLALGPLFFFFLNFYSDHFTCIITQFALCCLLLPISIWKEGNEHIFNNINNSN